MVVLLLLLKATEDGEDFLVYLFLILFQMGNFWCECFVPTQSCVCVFGSSAVGGYVGGRTARVPW